MKRMGMGTRTRHADIAASSKWLARTIAFAALFVLAAGLASAQVAVSQMGYHPDQQKRVVVYDSQASSFEVRSGSQAVYSGPLSQDECQGGQQCLVGDFSDFTTSGTYNIVAGGEQSPQFRIDTGVFEQHAHIFPEFFDALRLQGSSHHPDHHAAADPPLTTMQDGSYLHTTDMAAMTLIRIGQAYEKNPALFDDQIYFSGQPDMAANIQQYADYLAGLQDHDATLAVPRGWYYDFSCPTDTTLQEGQHNDEQDDCLIWDGEQTSVEAASALAAYAYALPALAAHDEQAAQQLLGRAVDTEQYIQDHYGSTQEPGRYGAALFLLYDFTGDEQYLQRAYDLRSDVSTFLSGEWTQGSELYWSEYIRHEQHIKDIGTYAVDGQQPEDIFAVAAEGDWTAIKDVGDRVHTGSARGFHRTRPMLMMGVQGEYAHELAGSDAGVRVSEAQAAWLTGQNRVDWGEDGMQSRSYIFGVGDYPTNQHTRLVPHQFYEEGREYLNGNNHILGWTGGVYDLDDDGLFDYRDEYYDWRFTEGTNHMTSLVMLHFAQLDARLNDREPLSRPFLEPVNETESGTDNQTGDEELADPGANSTLAVTGGTLNGQSATSTVSVEEGGLLAGSVDLSYDSAWDSGVDVYLGYTPTWGVLEEQMVSLGTISGTSQTTADINVSAPQQAGDYHLVFAYRAETTPQHVFSLTNWAAGDPAWGDDNTVAQFNTSQLAAAAADGRTAAQVLFDNGYETVQVPSAVIDIEVTSTSDSGTNHTNDSGDQTSNETACVEHVSEATASCEGGTITTDEYTGCRLVVCESGDSRIQVQACDKDTHFEMYKQDQQGTAVQQVCLSGTCITNEEFHGFARSDDYPVCEQEFSASVDLSASADSETDYTFVCDANFAADEYTFSFGDGEQVTQSGDQATHAYAADGDYTATCTASSQDHTAQDSVQVSVQQETSTGSGETCHESVTTMPATCEGGEFISDETSGVCRTVECSGSGETLQVQACDKDTHFEMYRQAGEGEVLDVCFGETCLDGWGYRQSGKFPICTDGTSDGSDDTTDETSNETDDTTQTSVDLRIKDWYPQGRDYVFVCESSSDTTEYQWVFGDGHSQTTTRDDVYHIYESAGGYTVTCTAAGASDSLQVSVQ